MLKLNTFDKQQSKDKEIERPRLARLHTSLVKDEGATERELKQSILDQLRGKQSCRSFVRDGIAINELAEESDKTSNLETEILSESSDLRMLRQNSQKLAAKKSLNLIDIKEEEEEASLYAHSERQKPEFNNTTGPGMLDLKVG